MPSAPTNAASDDTFGRGENAQIEPSKGSSKIVSIAIGVVVLLVAVAVGLHYWKHRPAAETSSVSVAVSSNVVAPGAEAPQMASVDAAQVTGCSAQSHCTPVAGTVIAAPAGSVNAICHDPTIWEELDKVGFQVSDDGENFRPYPCTLQTAATGTCAVVYHWFKFEPTDPSVTLPGYWFAPIGTRDCSSKT